MASTLSEPGRYPDHRLVRKLSETGAALDMVRRYVVPDRFTLALPLEGTSHRCRLAEGGGDGSGVPIRAPRLAAFPFKPQSLAASPPARSAES